VNGEIITTYAIETSLLIFTKREAAIVTLKLSYLEAKNTMNYNKFHSKKAIRFYKN